MVRNSLIFKNKEALEKILNLQKYPLEANEDLMLIAQDYPEVGLFEIILKAFHLGMIIGKRMERSKRKV